jgi:tetratricopeptide (TPR) repeat protein
MGKSSLRVRTMQRLRQEHIQCAAIDLSSIGSSGTTSEAWYRGFIHELHRIFNLFSAVHLGNWLSEHDQLSPVQTLSHYIEDVLLVQWVSDRIVIFIDEIDKVLSLNFEIGDFFAFIRGCYNQRVDKPIYRRLTFALLGVTTPSRLIQDKTQTPFNIGKAIGLSGLELWQAGVLSQGLAGYVAQPQKVLQGILDWTGGQPFLTQKLCQIVRTATADPNWPTPTDGYKSDWLDQLVRYRMIAHWEFQDEPEHLRTIRDRILRSPQRAGRLLELYQDILHQGAVKANDSEEHIELQLSGLVVRQHGKLYVYNRIYKEVFNQEWVEQTLTQLCPYAENLSAWLASNEKDDSRLLRGQALEEALTWGKRKHLSATDYKFLSASQNLDKQEIQQRLDTEAIARRVFERAHRKARRLLRVSFGITVAALMISIASLWGAGERVSKAQEQLIEAQKNLAQTQEEVNTLQADLADLTSNQQAEREEAEARRNQIRQVFRARTNQDYEGAIALLDEILDSDPGHHFARALRGDTYRLHGDWEEALTDLNQVIDADAGNAFALTSRGELHYAQGQRDEAQRDFVGAVCIYQTDSDRGFGLFLNAEQPGQLYRLEDFLQQRLDEFPDDQIAEQKKSRC